MEPHAERDAGCIAEHHVHVPSPRLARRVERAVGYRLGGFPAGVHVGMPSSTVTLVIPLDDRLEVSDAYAGRRAFDSVLAGLATGPSHIHHDGYQHGVQLALRPGAVRAFFGCPAAELAETSYELADVLGSRAARLRDRLHETDSWDRRFELVEQTLLAGEVDPRDPPAEVLEAWRLIAVSHGAVRIRDVAHRVGWSVRTLQQRFRSEFGVTPKEAARVRRFERSLPLVSSSRMPLSQVAITAGYADQPHLNREWRALAGRSPTRWLAEDVLIGG
ncbi:MAG: helix-turn-helix transcriptional regulator [Micrococcales bacterium]|nr:helix-turn-helix transcriptional regulator [Micrococcales bacterium]